MKKEKIEQAIKLLEELDNDFENDVCLRSGEEAMEEFSYYGIASMLKEHLDTLEKVPHFHCPVNGWDCPYYVAEKTFEGTTEPERCLCSLSNPMEDCDDFYGAWGDCDPEDYTDYIGEDSD